NGLAAAICTAPEKLRRTLVCCINTKLRAWSRVRSVYYSATRCGKPLRAGAGGPRTAARAASVRRAPQCARPPLSCASTPSRRAAAQAPGKLMDTLAGKVVLITGASEGIGRALALALAARGAHLALNARNAERLQATAQECAAHGVRVLALPADLGVAAQC